MIIANLTYSDIISVACEGHATFDAAAKRLGVTPQALRRVLKARGMRHWLPRGQPVKSSSVDLRELESLGRDGYTIKDAAYLMGISYPHALRLVRRHCRSAFPNRGAGAWKARRGYVG